MKRYLVQYTYFTVTPLSEMSSFDTLEECIKHMNKEEHEILDRVEGVIYKWNGKELTIHNQ